MGDDKPFKKQQKIPITKKRQAASMTEEGREKQLIALTISLAEKQIRAGTASSQVMTHFLKLGSTMESLEKEKLKKENLLLEAKTEAIKSGKNSELLFANALEAMSIYKGTSKSISKKQNTEVTDD